MFFVMESAYFFLVLMLVVGAGFMYAHAMPILSSIFNVGAFFRLMK